MTYIAILNKFKYYTIEYYYYFVIDNTTQVKSLNI